MSVVVTKAPVRSNSLRCYGSETESWGNSYAVNENYDEFFMAKDQAFHDHSMSCWVYVERWHNQEQVLMGYSQDDIATAWGHMRFDDGGGENNSAVNYTIRTVTTTRATATTNLWKTGRWHHVACTSLALTPFTHRIILDGDWANSDSVGRAGAEDFNDWTAIRFTLGMWNPSSGGTDSLNGYLFEPAIWDVVLTQAEIEALAEGMPPTAVNSGNLRHFWPMTHGDGASFNDAVGDCNMRMVGSHLSTFVPPWASPGANRSRIIPAQTGTPLPIFMNYYNTE